MEERKILKFTLEGGRKKQLELSRKLWKARLENLLPIEEHQVLRWGNKIEVKVVGKVEEEELRRFLSGSFNPRKRAKEEREKRSFLERVLEITTTPTPTVEVARKLGISLQEAKRLLKEYQREGWIKLVVGRGWKRKL